MSGGYNAPASTASMFPPGPSGGAPGSPGDVAPPAMVGFGSSSVNFSNDLTTGPFAAKDEKITEIREWLDGKSLRDKLEAMKRLIAMFSKGRDVSSLFADVVKNVVSDSLELRRLVYLYLCHYSEKEPELALLCVGTFQKQLLDKNPLVRSMALRVLSSIRVLDISAVVSQAIRACCADPSPYVRKTAAHALTKLYSLDPESKDECKELIGTLMADGATLVLGSAVNAFNEVCPDAWELVHPNYHKLCMVLADTDEWAQVVVLNMLVRYVRTQFIDPNVSAGDATEADAMLAQDLDSFFADEVRVSASGEKTEHYMHADHRLLLRCAQPLLQSRSSAVVLAVAMLYFHNAPRAESAVAGKALVRLIRSNREIEYVVLSNIASMVAQRPLMFAAQLKEFFVKAEDPKFVRDIKLEIMTQLAAEDNITLILRELKSYIRSSEVGFTTQAIDAVGRCAIRVPSMTESCLEGLISLLRSKSDEIVAEAIVAIRKLLKLYSGDAIAEVIKHMVFLLEQTEAPAARASIVWIIGEYCDRIPEYAPDVERKLAKSFPAEDEATKLQIVSMAAKLFLQNPAQTALLFDYIMNMGKYDRSYDIRDRVRYIHTVLAQREPSSLVAHANRLFQTDKPRPVVISEFADRAHFVVGSLAHLMGHVTPEYQPLPSWPEVEADAALRTPKEPLRLGGISTVGFGSNSFGQPVAAPVSHGAEASPAYAGLGLAATDLESWLGGGTLDDEPSYYTDDEYPDYSYYSDEGGAVGAAAGAAAAASAPAAAFGAFGARPAAAAAAAAAAPRVVAPADDEYYYSDE